MGQEAILCDIDGQPHAYHFTLPSDFCNNNLYDIITASSNFSLEYGSNQWPYQLIRRNIYSMWTLGYFDTTIPWPQAADKIGIDPVWPVRNEAINQPPGYGQPCYSFNADCPQLYCCCHIWPGFWPNLTGMCLPIDECESLVGDFEGCSDF